jgi:hypothetical protein
VKKVQFVACLFALAAMSTACFADSIPSETLVTSSNSNDGGFAGMTFTANLSTSSSNGVNSFALDLIVQNTSGTPEYLNDFTLSLLGGGNSSNISITLTSPEDSSLSSIGWTQAANAKINNGNNTTGCITGGSGYGGWVCAYGSTPLAITSGGYDFHFAGTYQGTVMTPFDLMANGSINGNKIGVSDYMSVPEPSSMLLMGGGLSGVALLRRLKKSKTQ